MLWFQLSIEQTLETLRTQAKNGLNPDEVQARQMRWGRNQLQQAARASVLKILLNQLKNPLFMVLTVGVLLSLYGEHFNDALAIAVIILINAAISFTQEYRAQKSMDALQQMAAPQAQVLRDGQWHTLNAAELVPGDIIKLNHGNVVPADARLLEECELQMDESALTGESLPVEKQLAPLAAPDTPLSEQCNLVFMSTLVVHGHGLAVVCATGMRTQVGRIAHLMQQAVPSMTPLQRRIHKLSKVLIAAALVVVLIVMAVGLSGGMTQADIVNAGISLAVAAIPEGLLTILTLVLTLGAKQMMQNKGLVRYLAAVETLGSTSVICSDKTGTLTQNKMLVTRFWVAGHFFTAEGHGYRPHGRLLNHQGETVDSLDNPHLHRLMLISALCNEAHLQHHEEHSVLHGTPTEGALLALAAKSGLNMSQLDRDWRIVRRLPFDSKRKRMSVVVQNAQGEHWLFSKGAPDVLSDSARNVQLAQETLPLPEGRAMVNEVVEEFANQALRTLAIGYRKLSSAEAQAPVVELEQELTLLGIHGIMDPPRPEATQAIEQCHHAGIRVIMITGDHAVTAHAIALQMGIIRAHGLDEVLTGRDLNELPDAALRDKVKTTRVFARVSPEHKLRIVEALQANDEVVAMTGDGVNDAPALRKADMGVAMGISGTDVAKESADLILLDDNFATIVHAVRQGRRIYDNIRKFIRQDLTTNVSEVSAFLLAFVVMIEAPLLTLAPMMILWINLISDGLPSLALGLDGEERDVMRRRPRAKAAGFFSEQLGQRILIRGLVMGSVTFALFFYALQLGYSLAYAQTVAFMTLIFGQLVLIFDSRSVSSLYRRNPFGNPWVVLAVLAAAALSLLMVYHPVGHLALGTVALEPAHLGWIFMIAALPTLLLSGLKELLKLKWL
jgi:Ca2+-transporting ATPase